MKISCDIALNLKLDDVKNRVRQAAEMAIKDTIVDIAGDVVRNSPWLTGNNARSIEYEAEGLMGKCYSTSGYGGYLEVGTWKMAAQPYFKPSLDSNFTEEKFAEKIEANL